MRSIAGCLFLLFFFLSRAFAQDEAELVKKGKGKLDQVNDYKAEGRMRMDVLFSHAPPSKVTLYFKKPDRFKVKKSGGISILPKGGVSINLGTLLAGGQYDVVPGRDVVIKGQTMRVVKLLPADEQSDLVLTTLYIDEKALLVRKATVSTKESG